MSAIAIIMAIAIGIVNVNVIVVAVVVYSYTHILVLPGCSGFLPGLAIIEVKPALGTSGLLYS